MAGNLDHVRGSAPGSADQGSPRGLHVSEASKATGWPFPTVASQELPPLEAAGRDAQDDVAPPPPPPPQVTVTQRLS